MSHLFGLLVVVCLAVAVYSYGKRLCLGLPRRRGRKTHFRPLDGVDEASIELSAAFSDTDAEDGDASGKQETEEETQLSPSRMRMNVLTSMM